MTIKSERDMKGKRFKEVKNIKKNLWTFFTLKHIKQTKEPNRYNTHRVTSAHVLHG
jgi:plasmid rolling circle replication initiator protein Rep